MRINTPKPDRFYAYQIIVTIQNKIARQFTFPLDLVYLLTNHFQRSVRPTRIDTFNYTPHSKPESPVIKTPMQPFA